MNFSKIILKLFYVICLICVSFITCWTAGAAESVKIAVITSETGIAVDDSAPIVQAAKMTIDEINKNGGLLGQPVKLIFIDNKSSFIGSESAAKKAVKLHVTGVIGASWSSHSLAMAPVLQKAGIPMITPASTDPKVTRIGNYIFRVCFTDELQGKIMAQFARRTLNAGTAAVMQNINEPYSLTLSDFFIRSFVKSGGKILLKGNYTGKSVDFKDILSRVKKLEPDVVFIPGYSRDSGLAICQARKMGIKAVFLGGDGWSLKMFDYAGSSLNGSYAAAPWYKDLPGTESRHLENIFFEKYKQPVYNGVIALTYDAIKVFSQAVKKAGSLDRKRIRDVLARTFDFKGTTGSITFDGTGDPIGKQVVIVKFNNNAYDFVKNIKEKTITIAAIYALTGKAAKSYKPSINGVINAVNEINDHGGIAGKKIKLDFIDNKSTPIGSKIAAEKAAADNVTAIIGPVWSSHAIAAAKVAQAHKIPMVATIATNPLVTQVGNYIFRVCFTDDFQGRVMANFAVRDLKAKSCVIFTNVESDYSLGLSREFKKNFELSGGRVLFTAMYKSALKNYRYLISRTRKCNPDVVFLSDHEEDSGFLAQEVQNSGIKATFLGGDGCVTENFMTKGGKYIKHGYFCTHWSEKSDNPVSLAFVKKYRQKGRLTPDSALVHDAVFLLADAIDRAKSLNKNKIRAALENTESFRGVTGTISFDKSRNPVKNVVINEINDGKIRYFKTIKP